MVELRQLKQFVAVAEELSFRRAAARLHMSQPPLTAAVKALEAEIGRPLFDRSKHHVKLTEPGYLFLFEARRILAQAERAVQIAQSASNGVLHLSHLGSATLGLLPPLLRHFQRDYPSIELNVTMAGTFHQIEMLRRGEVDLGLIRVPIEDARGLKVTVLCEEKMLIAVPADHPLAGRKSVKIEMLAAEPFISYPPPEGPSFEGIFVSACQRAGILSAGGAIRHANVDQIVVRFGRPWYCAHTRQHARRATRQCRLFGNRRRKDPARLFAGPGRADQIDQPRHYRIRRHREQIRGQRERVTAMGISVTWRRSP